MAADASGEPSTSLVVLHVAEKPSVALAIATALSGGQRFRSVDGALPTHEFTARLPLGNAAPSLRRHRVTSVRGHVFALDFAPGPLDSWDADPEGCFAAPTLKSPCSAGVVGHLSAVARGAAELVLWLDADAEGESIAFEVAHVCEPHLSSRKSVLRARFSAVSPAALLGALKTLGEPDVRLAAAVDARQELDLRLGVAWTRYLTRRLAGRFGSHRLPCPLWLAVRPTPSGLQLRRPPRLPRLVRALPDARAWLRGAARPRAAQLHAAPALGSRGRARAPNPNPNPNPNTGRSRSSSRP